MAGLLTIDAQNVQAWAVKAHAGTITVLEARHLLLALTHDSMPKPVVRVDDYENNVTTGADLQELIQLCLDKTGSAP